MRALGVSAYTLLTHRDNILIIMRIFSGWKGCLKLFVVVSYSSASHCAALIMGGSYTQTLSDVVYYDTVILTSSLGCAVAALSATYEVSMNS